MRYPIILLIPLLALLAACNGGGQPTPTSTGGVEDSPTTAPSAPAVVDPQEVFVVGADGGEPILIASSAYYVPDVGWSPDGQKVGVLVPGDEKAAIRVASASGTVLWTEQLEGPDSETLSWSPDSKWLAAGSRVGQVLLMDAEDGNFVQAYRTARFVTQLLWSPGGDQLAVKTQLELTNNNVLVVVALMDPGGGGTAELYRHEARAGTGWLNLLSWQSDRSLLATRHSEVIAIDTVNSEVSVIADAGGRIFESELSPEGSRVALVTRAAEGGCPDSPSSLVVLDIANAAVSPPAAEGCIGAVAWSPDGEMLAYAISEKGTYVLNLASGETRRLTVTEGDFIDSRLEWLSDGSGVVIQRCFEGCGEPFLVAPGGGSEQFLADTWELFLSDFGAFAPDSRRYLFSNDAVRVGRLGGEVTALTQPDPAMAYSNLSWSPGGYLIAYVRTPSDKTRRYAVEVETGEVTLLKDTEPGARSPDGELVAFYRHQQPGQTKGALWLANADGSSERLLADIDVAGFAWSPDSRYIAYSSYETGTGHLADVRTMETRQLPVSGGDYSEFRWSPDGSRLAWVGGGEPTHPGYRGGGDLLVIDVRTGTSTTIPQGVLPAGLEWSPDGRNLAYLKRTSRSVVWVFTDVTHLWIMNTETGHSGQATSGSGRDIEPAWSPDGRKVLYRTVVADDSVHLGIVDIETGKFRQITSGRVLDSYPSWSPDGQTVVFVRTVLELESYRSLGFYIVPADKGNEINEIPVAPLDPRNFETGPPMAWSPDGERIAIYAAADAREGIFVVEADGSEFTQIAATSRSSRSYGEISWSEDGRKVLFSSFYVGY